MRHAVFGRRLSRDTNARRALLNNLTSSLFESGQITTTLAKAKFAKPYVEKLITGARADKLFIRRTLATNLTSRAFKRLFEEIAPGFKSRNGGYARIIKLKMRKGDSAKMAKLELLEWEKPKTLKKTAAKKTQKSKVAKKSVKKEKAKTLAKKK